MVYKSPSPYQIVYAVISIRTCAWTRPGICMNTYDLYIQSAEFLYSLNPPTLKPQKRQRDQKSKRKILDLFAIENFDPVLRLGPYHS